MFTSKARKSTKQTLTIDKTIWIGYDKMIISGLGLADRKGGINANNF